jgi:hypothetical protein
MPVAVALRRVIIISSHSKYLQAAGNFPSLWASRLCDPESVRIWGFGEVLATMLPLSLKIVWLVLSALGGCFFFCASLKIHHPISQAQYAVGL